MSEVSESISRRLFVASVPVVAAAVAPILSIRSGLRAATLSPHWEHPEPRPGIDGSNVLAAEDLRETPHVIEIFDGIRQIPHVADGIRCHCGCAELPHTRSLLSCYEEGGMARYCEICQGEGRLAYRRAGEGQTLDQIRRAIDARYGPAPDAL